MVNRAQRLCITLNCMFHCALCNGMFFRRLFGSNNSITAPKAKELLRNGAVLVDVRTPGEYASGHARQSRNVPLDQLPKQLDSLKRIGKPIVFVCASGARSQHATDLARQAGIEAYNAGSWSSLR